MYTDLYNTAPFPVQKCLQAVIQILFNNHPNSITNIITFPAALSYALT